MVNLSESRERVESRERGRVIIMVALPEAGVGQEAEVGQGLPNTVFLSRLFSDIVDRFFFNV